MANIQISVVFSENCYIARQERVEIPYNSCVSSDKNLLICYKCNSETDWEKLDWDNIVNKDKRGFFKRLFGSKYDPNRYTFYIVDKAQQTGRLFGNINAKARPTNFAKVQWRVEYSFQAVSPVKIVKNLVKNSSKDTISREEIRKVIVSKIQTPVSNAIAKALANNGKSAIERFDSIKDECIREINELPELSSNDFGLIIKAESIEIDLENTIKEVQKEIEIKSFIENKGEK